MTNVVQLPTNAPKCDVEKCFDALEAAGITPYVVASRVKPYLSFEMCSGARPTVENIQLMIEYTARFAADGCFGKA